MENVSWPNQDESSSQKAEPWYEESCRTALRRVAAVLNSQKGGLCQNIKFSCSDDKIDELFKKNNWDEKIIQKHKIEQDTHNKDDTFNAEYFFYGFIDFPERRKLQVVQFYVTQTFLDWGYTRLNCPFGRPEELGVDKFGKDNNSPDFIRSCAVNYLVKNFWHNFVHRKIQGITSSNYHDFRGRAREDSDFEADNLANALLVHSYGYPIRAKGKIGNDTSKEIAALFRRNRCNKIFEKRALHRRAGEPPISLDEAWSELEWRFCRRVSNEISMALIQSGLATPSLKVFSRIQIKKSQRKNGQFIEEGTVLIEINGRRINSNCTPYIADEEVQLEQNGTEINPSRKKDIDGFKMVRVEEIVKCALTNYRKLMDKNGKLQQSVELAWRAVSARIDIPIIKNTDVTILQARAPHA